MIFYLFSITYNLLMVLNFHYLMIANRFINLLQIDIHDIIYLNEFISWFSIHATNIYLQVTFSENTFFTISTSSTKCNQCWKIVILLQWKRMMQNDYTRMIVPRKMITLYWASYNLVADDCFNVVVALLSRYVINLYWNANLFSAF